MPLWELPLRRPRQTQCEAPVARPLRNLLRLGKTGPGRRANLANWVGAGAITGIVRDRNLRSRRLSPYGTWPPVAS